MMNTTLDDCGTTLILGDCCPYYKVSFGAVVQSYSGSPIIELFRNGKGTGIAVPVCGTGNVSIDWIDSFGPHAALQWVVREGCIELLSSCANNAYFNVLGIR
ncbi:MAG: hypothetical protein LBQ15_01550 [Clostridium sp.]|jgi:hypothetical protein|nr:hypothetical protein [Clostridium sp.]